MEDNWLPMPRYKLRRDLVKRILARESLSGKTCLEFGYGSGDMLLLYASLGIKPMYTAGDTTTLWPLKSSNMSKMASPA